MKLSRRGNHLRRKLLLACFAAFIGLGAGELWLRFVQPAYVLTYPPGFFAPDDHLERCLSPNFSGHYRATWPRIPLTTNAQGFRDVEHLWERQRDVRTVLVVGDSFTLGPDVALEGLYFRHLEERLNRVLGPDRWEVIAMAVGGYGTAHELKLLRRWVPKLKPDCVVLQFYENDIDDSWRLNEQPESPPVLWKPDPGPSFTQVLTSAARKSYIVDAVAFAHRNRKVSERPDMGYHLLELPLMHARRLELTAVLLGQASELIQENSATGFVLIVPSRATVERSGFFESSGQQINGRVEYDADILVRRIRLAAKMSGMISVSLLEPFRSQVDRGLFNPHDPHLSVAGHEIASDALFASIRDQAAP